MNTKVLAVLLVALQCGALMTQAARPLGEEASHGSSRKVLDSSASLTTGTRATSNDVEGFAAAKAKAFAKNSNIVVLVSANSTAISNAESAIAKATSEAIAKVKGGGKVVAAAKAAAEATGIAIAKAQTATFTQIESDGVENSGCGVAKANAKAEAKAFVLAIAEAFTTAENSKAASSARGKVTGIQTVYVEAFSESVSFACLKGKGTAKAAQNAFSLAVAEMFVSVYADALAYVKGSSSGGGSFVGGNLDIAESTSVGAYDESFINGVGFVSGGNDAGALVKLFP